MVATTLLTQLGVEKQLDTKFHEVRSGSTYQVLEVPDDPAILAAQGLGQAVAMCVHGMHSDLRIHVLWEHTLEAVSVFTISVCPADD